MTFEAIGIVLDTPPNTIKSQMKGACSIKKTLESPVMRHHQPEALNAGLSINVAMKFAQKQVGTAIAGTTYHGWPENTAKAPRVPIVRI